MIQFLIEESDAGRDGGRNGWEMRGLRRGALGVEFEHARTFAGWDAAITIFGLTRLTLFG